MYSIEPVTAIDLVEKAELDAKSVVEESAYFKREWLAEKGFIAVPVEGDYFDRVETQRIAKAVQIFKD